MRVLGLEANIGSMLYPFQERGHEVVGNYDSRGIVRGKNFTENFPDSELFDEPEDLYDLGEIDVVMSQPSCGKFSSLSRKNRCDYDDGFNVWKHLNVIKPKLFFVESKLDYIDEIVFIPGYKYRVEWISNYYYGNVQKGRNRLWVIGIREDTTFNFYHNERTHENTTRSIIEDLPAIDMPSMDHEHFYSPFIKNSITKEYLDLDEAFAMLLKQGKLTYLASDGTIKNRINRRIANPITSTTITGSGTWFHWEKKYPLTLREKARIQGFSDGFSFKHMPMTAKHRAVGKSIPSEFINHLVDILENPDNVGEDRKIVPEPIKLTIFKRINSLILAL